jgi:prepilin-type N-terminal cleavage/methylation domain-containing protein
MKKRNQKGFTLAELLIVVAIIAVLVAIAIPIFTKQLEKSRESTDISNVRSAAAEVTATYLSDNSVTTATVPAKQQDASDWAIGSEKAVVTQQIEGSTETTDIPLTTGNYVVSIDSTTGKVSMGTSN